MSLAIDATTPVPLIEPGSRVASRLYAALVVALVAIYLLLQNPYWVRYGDGEVYLSIARSLANGNGYRFNGQPVAIVPPLWPMILAVAMKINPSLAFLKMLPLAAMIGFLLISYQI